MDDGGGFRKARMELEALYEGVPDESVNLTFRHLTDVNLQSNSSFEKKRANPSIQIPIPRDNQSTPLTKLPSLDFNRALQAANQYSRPDAKISLHPSAQAGGSSGSPLAPAGDIQSRPTSEHEYMHAHVGGLRPALEYSAAYEEASRISGMGSMYLHHRATPGRRRPGIPHSNICTNCTTYIYVFRHRCLVCGRVYCRQCVRIGMGEMTEGRKCIECLGRKFSHRYIGEAGDVGCFGWRYSTAVKHAELKWAEKGPRRKGERVPRRGYGGGVTNSMSMMSASQSPWAPATTSVDISAVYSSRFAAMSSPHSPSHRHHLPF